MRSSAGFRGRRRSPDSEPIRDQYPGHVIKHRPIREQRPGSGPMRTLITPMSSVSPASVRMVVTSVPVFRAKTRYMVIINYQCNDRLHHFVELYVVKTPKDKNEDDFSPRHVIPKLDVKVKT